MVVFVPWSACVVAATLTLAAFSELLPRHVDAVFDGIRMLLLPGNLQRCRSDSHGDAAASVAGFREHAKSA